MQNKFCPRCGAKIENNEKYCSKCGTSLSANNTNDDVKKY